MSGRRGLLLGVVAILLSGSGCVCCGDKGYGLAREVGPDCDVPSCQRNQVYVFVVGGMNPLKLTALDEVREKLNRQGFAKVATGQSVYAWWMASEMRRVREDQPNAVFVLLGVEGGTATAVRLAEKAAADGLPVGALVLIDPEAMTMHPTSGVRTLTLTASDASAIGELLNEIAVTTPPRPTEEVTEWHYQHAPLPRPMIDPARAPEWVYLFDQPGGNTRPIGESERVIVSQPATPTASAVRR